MLVAGRAGKSKGLRAAVIGRSGRFPRSSPTSPTEAPAVAEGMLQVNQNFPCLAASSLAINSGAIPVLYEHSFTHIQRAHASAHPQADATLSYLAVASVTARPRLPSRLACGECPPGKGTLTRLCIVGCLQEHEYAGMNAIPCGCVCMHFLRERIRVPDTGRTPFTGRFFSTLTSEPTGTIFHSTFSNRFKFCCRCRNMKARKGSSAIPSACNPIRMHLHSARVTH